MTSIKSVKSVKKTAKPTSYSVEEAKGLIATDRDFVYCKRFGYSLEACLDKYPDGLPIRLISQCLLMSEDEVESTYQSVIKKLREIMKVEAIDAGEGDGDGDVDFDESEG